MNMLHTIGAALCLATATSATAAVEPPDGAGKETGIAPRAAQELLRAIQGHWEGNCRTWFKPGVLADESPLRGSIEPVLEGRFVRHLYEGSIEGRPRHGEELMAFNTVTHRFEVSWIDDFHMGYGIMFSQGEPTPRGFAVSGHYDVAPGTPRWGWKTVLELVDPDHLVITSYNVSPEGEEARAVETRYTRVSP